MRIAVQIGLALVLLGSGAAIAGLMSEQQRHQTQRELTRVLSEVFHRAKSYELLGEVVRPRFGSPNVDLPREATAANWVPTCESEIVAEPNDPTERPFALVLVPRHLIFEGGSGFTAYAVFSGAPPMSDHPFDPPAPDWLVEDLGGYRSLRGDLDALTSRSEIRFEFSTCEGFSYAKVIGRPR